LVSRYKPVLPHLMESERLNCLGPKTDFSNVPNIWKDI
jgi:hypothetical protein